MWKWIAIAGLGATLAVAVTFAWNVLAVPEQPEQSTAVVRKGPVGRVQVESTTYDFGSMEQATTGSHTFVIKNAGEGILELHPRKPTCGCQKLVLESDAVPEGAPKKFVWQEDEEGNFPENVVFRVLPGGTVKATVQWDTKLETGQYREAVPMDTNDPDQPRITFEITGFVTPLVLFSTGEIKGEASTSRETTFSMVVASEVLSDIRIVDLTSVLGEVTLRSEPVDPSTVTEFPDAGTLKCAHRVYITVPPGLPVGPYRDKITITLELPERPDPEGKPSRYKTDVNLYVQVRGPVTVTRPLVNFGDVEVSKGASERLFVIIRDVDNPTLDVASVEPDFVNVRIEPTSDPRRFSVMLEVPPHAPFGQFEGRVVLKTNHPEASTARIILRGTVVEDL